VHPDGRQLKLWAQAIEKLAFDGVPAATVRGCLQKFYVQPHDATAAALPLAAVYILQEARLSRQRGIQRPNVVDGALLLSGSAYRPLLVTRLQQKEHYFLAAAQIANKAGIFCLTRPLDFAAMPEVISWLENHWRELGLTEKAA
jgi:hypothetical protein